MMNNRYALVDAGGQVMNIVEWDGEAEWSPPEGLAAVDAEGSVSKGWRLEDGVWTAPEEEDPEWT